MSIALDPGIGGRSIAPGALKIADIVLSTTPAGVSKAIRLATLSKVSHAMLCIGGDLVVEAIGDGVVQRSIFDAVKEANLAVAYRHPGLTEMQALKVRDFAGRQVGKDYNYGALIRQAGVKLPPQAQAVGLAGFAGFSLGCWITGDVECANMRDKVNPFIKRDEFFCSQLVLAAYEHAGVALTTKKPVWSSPEDIAKARLKGKLLYVGHLKA